MTGIGFDSAFTDESSMTDLLLNHVNLNRVIRPTGLFTSIFVWCKYYIVVF